MHFQVGQLAAERQHNCQRLDFLITPLEFSKVELAHTSHHRKHCIAKLGSDNGVAIGAIGVRLVAVRVAAKERERL